MPRDLFIGVDSSTSATKAIVFDAAGTPLAEARRSYPTSTPAQGYFEQDPEDWWTACLATVREVSAAVGPARIAGLAIGQQRESFTLIDGQGKALRPGILWLDERARREVSELCARFGRETLRDITGKPPDPTPSLYALAWLKTHEPQVLKSARAVVEVHGFLLHRLTGCLVTSLPAADPLALIDLAKGSYHLALVEATGLTPDQLPELLPPGVIAGGLTGAAAAATGLPSGLPVVTGAGDGQIGGLGLGAIGPDIAYLSLGTGIVTGMYSLAYRTSDAHRTLASPTGSGFMVETVLRSGMTLADWAARLTRGLADGATLGVLEAEAAALPVGAEGLMLMPYWAGVMNPWWDEAARGAILGFSLNHGPAHLFRAVLEGLAMEQAMATEALEASLGQRAARFVTSGGGTKSTLMTSLMAAALGRPLALSPVTEAVAAGAAILAAAGTGRFPSIAAAMDAMAAKPDRLIEPNAALQAALQPRLAIYRDVFPALRQTMQRLAAC